MHFSSPIHSAIGGNNANFRMELKIAMGELILRRDGHAAVACLFGQRGCLWTARSMMVAAKAPKARRELVISDSQIRLMADFAQRRVIFHGFFGLVAALFSKLAAPCCALSEDS